MARVLVVDDSQVARQELLAPLKAAGFDTAEAENGKLAFELAQKGGIDLIVTDVHMPLMNGIEMCEALHKAMGAAAMPPVLVVSTESNNEMKTRGKASGVKGWIIKPVDTTKLIQVAGMLINKNKGA